MQPSAGGGHFWNALNRTTAHRAFLVVVGMVPLYVVGAGAPWLHRPAKVLPRGLGSQGGEPDSNCPRRGGLVYTSGYLEPKMEIPELKAEGG